MYSDIFSAAFLLIVPETCPYLSIVNATEWWTIQTMLLLHTETPYSITTCYNWRLHACSHNFSFWFSPFFVNKNATVSLSRESPSHLCYRYSTASSYSRKIIVKHAYKVTARIFIDISLALIIEFTVSSLNCPPTNHQAMHQTLHLTCYRYTLKNQECQKMTHNCLKNSHRIDYWKAAKISKYSSCNTMHLHQYTSRIQDSDWNEWYSNLYPRMRQLDCCSHDVHIMSLQNHMHLKRI